MRSGGPPAGSLANPRMNRLLTFRAAESAHQIEDEADEQDQAKAASANDGTAEVKPASTENEKQDNNE